MQGRSWVMGVGVSGFRDLRVWQQGMDLVEQVYRISQDFPRSELYGLTSQLRRAAVSVPANIAEGHNREHIKEYLHHLSVAQGPLAEVQTELEIAARLNYVPSELVDPVQGYASALARQVRALRNALARRK